MKMEYIDTYSHPGRSGSSVPLVQRAKAFYTTMLTTVLHANAVGLGKVLSKAGGTSWRFN